MLIAVRMMQIANNDDNDGSCEESDDDNENERSSTGDDAIVDSNDNIDEYVDVSADDNKDNNHYVHKACRR